MATVTGTAFDDTITPTHVSGGVSGMPTAGDDTIAGLDGDDLLDAGDGDDTLTGGGGDDLLFGGAGHNVFEFATGWDVDIVADIGDAGAADRNDLKLLDIASTDTGLFVYRSGDSLGFLYAPTGDAIAVPDFFLGAGDWRLVFSDAVNIGPTTDVIDSTTGFGSDGIPDYQQIPNLTIGSPFNDTIVLPTSTYIEAAYGNLGDDHLFGSASASLLVGGGGSDHLYSGSSDLGTFMAGGADGDTYDLASGHLITIKESGGSAGDVLDASPLLTTSLIAATVEGRHLAVANMAGTTGFVMLDWQEAASQIESIQFGDVTVSFAQYAAAFASIPDLTWAQAGVDPDLIEEGLRVVEVLEGGPAGPDLPLTIGGTAGNDILRSLPGDNPMFGGAGDDVIYGAAGDDFIDGGTGDDRLVGGAGNDTLTGARRGEPADDNSADYSGASGPVTVTLAATATVAGDVSVGTDTLLVIDDIIGTPFNDTFEVFGSWTGGQFGTWCELWPGAGADTITVETDPGTGEPLVRIRIAYGGSIGMAIDLGAGTAQSLTGTGPVDTFSGVYAIKGTHGGDQLFGSDGLWRELFRPRGGNDTVDGRGGPDVVDYRFAAAGVTVNLALNTASDGFGDTDTLMNIEDAIGTRPFSDILLGNAVANHLEGLGGNDTLKGAGGADILDGGDGDDLLHGGSGSDTLQGGDGSDTLLGLAGDDDFDGGHGADTMKGGPGNDSYVVDDPGDVINEGAGYGVDEVVSGISYKLAVNVENLALTGAAAIDGYGNTLANFMSGNGAANTLRGGNGDDLLFGEGGQDKLVGGVGDDFLDGGLGADRLWGGAGDDVFDYNSVDASAPGGRDRIRDFSGVGTGTGDVVDLADIDALPGGDDDPFMFIGTAAFSAAGQLRVRAQGQHTMVEADLTGDGNADLSILVADGAASPDEWTAADFVL